MLTHKRSTAYKRIGLFFAEMYFVKKHLFGFGCSSVMSSQHAMPAATTRCNRHHVRFPLRA